MGMGPMFRELCKWEVGGTSGMVTEDSVDRITWSLRYLEGHDSGSIPNRSKRCLQSI
jgi:hypothetical protein